MNTNTLRRRQHKDGGLDGQEYDEQEKLYFVMFLETKHPSEATNALDDMINEINDLFKRHAVFRMRGDRASELTGETVKAYVRPKGGGLII